MIADRAGRRWNELLVWLVDEGLIAASDVVRGDLVLRDLSRRNENVLVERRDAPSHFVKIARGSEARIAIEREAACYKGLAAAGRSDLAPGFRRHHVADGVLVLEGLPAARDLRVLHTGADSFPAKVGGLLGTALARLHGAGHGGGAGDPPWVLALHRPTVGALGRLTTPSIDLLRVVQSDPGIGRALDGLRAGWSASALVHGDLKWDNVLADSLGRSLWLIDWESAAPGDPLWDVGSAMAGYVSSWLFSIDARPDVPLEDLPGRARHPLDSVTPAIVEFWRAYDAGLSGGVAHGALERTIRFAGARLLATAWEATQGGGSLNPQLVLHLQVGANLLQRPLDSVGSFGLAESAATG